ncbi:thiamine-phosphate kinase [Halonotius terrestris]|uniref:Thiamine-monophosphate kinase n=1 Tax=Halonotius terrestris TaxID=2487750 RepID=A0A8J8TCK2_9EURY|nr:thiamine-phosphate kinase [Halonotius terrestris]TQQ80961.1 thiamine-phosphate kinase [Halonotius terrestris]
MDERAALRQLAATLPHAGDDAAVVDGTAITTDMLHATTDFPAGTTRYTAGWRSVAASLSDLAAVGAQPTAAVAAYADTAFDADELADFVDGAQAVCEAVGAEYVGGDLDSHSEFTVATTAIGDAVEAVDRASATPGDRVVVTGAFGRSAAALRLFEREDFDRANDLFQFSPRIDAGRALADTATAMMDSSDGLARSLHQLAEASDCGFAIDREAVPVADALAAVADDADDRWEAAVHFGEDFELVATVPAARLDDVRAESPTPLTEIGRVVDAEEGITANGEPLADRGYTHG